MDYFNNIESIGQRRGHNEIIYKSYNCVCIVIVHFLHPISTTLLSSRHVYSSHVHLVHVVDLLILVRPVDLNGKVIKPSSSNGSNVASNHRNHPPMIVLSKNSYKQVFFKFLLGSKLEAITST